MKESCDEVALLDMRNISALTVQKNMLDGK